MSTISHRCSVNLHGLLVSVGALVLGHPTIAALFAIALLALNAYSDLRWPDGT